MHRMTLAALASGLMIAGCGDTTEAEDVPPTDMIAARADQPEAVPYPDSARQIPEVAPDPAARSDCNADIAQVFVGDMADAETRGRLLSEVAPITTVRWVGPGEATTDDLDADRLNVMLDASGAITGTRCG
ncbi:I78 family peptidase inhibitor [Pseudopontixanthobacter vadosimaris]|uniref:I78 family peptidase inhibitor n=1 Tax=Pseudopontixanthobacter vadosimaris TaxID=2726450 RepID=UPI001473EA11|nr:I78 family peptidase inhibitor [Pseudopontixanthobacter vadosimaris]